MFRRGKICLSPVYSCTWGKVLWCCTYTYKYLNSTIFPAWKFQDSNTMHEKRGTFPSWNIPHLWHVLGSIALYLGLIQLRKLSFVVESLFLCWVRYYGVIKSQWTCKEHADVLLLLVLWLSHQVLLNLWVLIAYNMFGGLQPLLTGKPVIEQDVPTGSKALTMRCGKPVLYMYFYCHYCYLVLC